MILSGKVHISKTGTDKVETGIADCGPGDIPGEMSVFDGAHSESARAARSREPGVL